MPTAQPALLAGTKVAGATTDVRVVSTVRLSIVCKRPTAHLPLMLSVGTVCPGEPAVLSHAILGFFFKFIYC